MNEKVTPANIPVIFNPKVCKRINGFDCPTKELIFGGLAKENGSKAFAYWNSTDLVTSGGYDGAVSLEIAGVSGYVHLVDPMDGSVYEIGNDIMNDKGGGLYVFEHLPVKDYPLILTFGDFIN